MLQLESLDHIMHGGSSKKDKKRQLYQLNEFRTLHTSGEICLPCMYQFESDLQMISNEVEYQLKVFERRALGTPRLSKCMST